MHAKPGDTVQAGHPPLLTLHGYDSARFDRALEALAGSVQISQDVASSYQPTPLVIDRIAV
jgi:thymidine phosphorylase